MQHNLWLNLWIHTRATTRELIDQNRKKGAIFFSLIWGVLVALNFLTYAWVAHPEYPRYHHPLVILIAVILGAIKGVVCLYIGGWLYTMTGRWIHGSGKVKDLLCALGWSFYPFCVALVLNLLNTLFARSYWLGLTTLILYTIAFVWAFIISLKAIGEAHRFSAWKAFLAILIGLLLVVIVIIIIAFIIPLLKPLFAH